MSNLDCCISLADQMSKEFGREFKIEKFAGRCALVARCGIRGPDSVLCHCEGFTELFRNIHMVNIGMRFIVRGEA